MNKEKIKPPRRCLVSGMWWCERQGTTESLRDGGECEPSPEADLASKKGFAGAEEWGSSVQVQQVQLGTNPALLLSPSTPS